MKHRLVILVFLVTQVLVAQPDSLFIKFHPEKEKYDSPEWIQKNKFGIDLSEVAFVNWNSGGSNSISGLLGFESSANYKDPFFYWNNNVKIRYGINKQESRELRKTDDLFELNSNLGYQPDKYSHWFYSARFNFKTQLANGYKYPNRDNEISRLMAPGYLFLGAGMEYGKQIDELSLYFSPLTLKTTFVLDQDLANAGSFGVEPAVLDSLGNVIVEGDRIRSEVGMLLTNSYEMEVAENIKMSNQLSLYSDYINNFGNVDIDWQLTFDFKVNSFVKATFGSHLKYDDDVKTTEPSEIEGEFDEAGAKVQWKQILGVGFAVNF
ncbi:hypothetical protein APS56_05055 [Pseudalgibacter alginicilyticus]|uniref:DUF3078 domain-containing protein n=1 Tax=Pseudalgibacter alginicilyticus TaxID=1736674 RepID=A0A0P0DF92_9FLAO|nr:DUF3078 domain-containing protein [Pseudalgibacter alginicilyticus]ALJ06737.1 hypothetical protein APS56_05055 [Pseudalgibacter alginicilyticus]